MVNERCQLDRAIDADAWEALPDECRQKGYFCVNEQQLRESWVAQNALRQGWPVLVKGVGSFFDPSPFTVEALMDIAKWQNAQVCSSPLVHLHMYIGRLL